MCAPACRKTNLVTSRTPSPTKLFTNNRQIVGAGALNTCPSPLSLRDISPHCGESPDVPKLVFRQTQGLPKAAPTNVSNHNVNAYLLYTRSIIFFGQNRKNAQNIPLVIVHRAEFVCYVLTFAHFDDIIYT